MNLAILVALAVLAPSQDSATKVTYKTVAEPITKVLADVSKTTGLHLEASGVMRSEIVVVGVKDCPVESFKEQLARAVVGRWTKSADGTEYLEPDNEGRNSMEREAQKARANSIAESLKKIRSAQEKGPKEEGMPPMFGGGDGAAERLIIKLSTSLKPSELALVPKGGRVVYSTSPNSLQKLISVPNMASIVSEYVAANNKEVEAQSGREGIDPAEKEQLAKLEKLMGGFMPKTKKITTPPAKILLIVERGGSFGGFGDSLDLKVVAFDSEGGVLGSGSMPLESMITDMIESTELIAEGQNPDKKAETPKHDAKFDKKIEYSAISTELMGLSSPSGMMAGDKAPSPELLEHLMHPDIYDPLSYSTSESLLALADAMGKNVVASLPDDAAESMTQMVMGGEHTLWSVKEGLSNNKALKVSETESFLSVSPADPANAARTRVDRVSLTKLMTATANSLVPSLEALSAYAAVNPPIMETPVVMPSLMFVAPNTISMGMKGGQDWQMLRLYGLLGAGERNALRSGQPLTMGALNGKAQTIVRQMVYGAGAKFQVGPDPTDDPALGVFAMAMSSMAHNIDSYKQEPTELLPTGLPNQATLSLKLEPGNFVLMDSKAGMARFFGAMGPDEFAVLKYFSEDPKMSAAASMMPKLDKMRVGERDTMNFRIQLASDVSQKHTLLDHRIDPKSAVVGQDGLPADFMAKTKKQMELFKEGFSPFLAGGAMFGGGAPPR